MLIVKEKLSEILIEALINAKNNNELDVQIPTEVKIEYPKDEKFGDYSTPIAMELAKVLKTNPATIADVIAKYLKSSSFLEKVDVVRPGFINMFISKEVLVNVLDDIVDLNENYGLISKKNPQKISIEFVSANPTGPLNIVSARAAAVGDTLANLLEASGDVVDREFYVNDFGNQVRLLGESVLARYKEIKGETISFPEDGYRGEYIKDIAQYLMNKYSDEIDNISEHGDLVDFLSRKAIEYNVEGQQKVMRTFRVEYNQWFRERVLHENGSVNKTYQELEAKNVIFEQDGKKFFRSTDYGDDKDRVVIRDDLRPTYLLADIAYHRDKFLRKYDRVIDIWGPDHHGYIDRLAGAMTALGYNKNNSFKVLIAQQVNLIQNGELVKMSKRLGQFSTMQDLIDEIGVDVARYFFVMRSMDSHLDFDLELAKKESSENPVFYLQYAYARICSIFREALSRGLSFSPALVDKSVLSSQEAVKLLKYLSRYPEEIKDAASVLEPHRIASYLLKLAQSFHRFYSENRVLTEDVNRTMSLLTICHVVKIVMRNGLKLVGVNNTKKM